MRIGLLMVTLALAAVLVPWQLGYQAESLAAGTDFSIGWTAMRPSPVVAGKTATLETRVQARRAATVTVEATVRTTGGQAAWQQRWPDQTFKAWQTRSYTANWAVPADQAPGGYTLAIRVLDSAGAELALTRTVSFQIVAGSAAATATATQTAAPTRPPTNSPTPSTTPTPQPATPTRTATPAPSPTRTATATPPPATPTPTLAATATPTPAPATATPTRPAAKARRRVNAPHFSGAIPYEQTAIFWFGRVTPTENYSDVRIGYNDDELYLQLNVFDRRLWYDTTPSPHDLTAWDAATLYLSLAGDTGAAPSSSAYRFVAQLNPGGPQENYRTVDRGNGASWTPVAIPFTTLPGWRGNALNDASDDRGWAMTFRIPFASLGLAGPPAPGTVWGLALALHDRDDAAGTTIATKVWPEVALDGVPSSWGQLSFGLPGYAAPATTNSQTYLVRHKLNGQVVVDAAAGGHTTCGDGLDFWTQWGAKNYAGEPDFNIQNQADPADWPCFSKYYVTFPLDALPPGQAVASAQLILHQFGNADPSQAQPSLIQVLVVEEDWSEATLTWNNAPLAAENVGRGWVDPITAAVPWPGLARTWDISRAAAEAYAAGKPLRLVLYSSDAAYHSGKYFVSSDTGDWNEAGRPTLRVVLGSRG